VLLLLISTLGCTVGDLHVPEWTLGPNLGEATGDGGTGGGTGDDGGGTGDDGGGTGDDGGDDGSDGSDGTPSIIDELNEGEDAPCATGDESTRVPFSVENTSDVVSVDVVASLDDCSRITVGTVQPLETWTLEYSRIGDAYVFTYIEPESGEAVDWGYIIVGDDAPTVVIE